jgi:hypothetical protein
MTQGTTTTTQGPQINKTNKTAKTIRGPDGRTPPLSLSLAWEKIYDEWNQ